MPDIAYYQSVYHCFSDQTRIRVISLMLRFQQVCTIDMEWALDITQAKSSRHLRVMDYARLVNRTRVENWVFYSIKPEVVPLIKSIIEPFENDQLLVQDAEHYRVMLANRELAASKLYLKSFTSNSISQ